MTELTDEKLEQGRRLARRRMAWISFLFLIASGGAILAHLLWNPARAEIAAALSTGSVVITGVFTALTAIVAGYLGASVVERIKKG